MKKLMIAILMAGATLFAIPSCTKSSSGTSSSSTTTTTTPTSSYDITVNGHTYHRSSTNTAIPGFFSLGIAVNPNDCQAQISIGDGAYIGAWFFGDKSDTTNKVGTYTVASNPASYIKDFGDHSIYYNLSGTGNVGTITITLSNNHEIKGTFSVTGMNGLDTLQHNITGYFDYNH